MTNMNFSKNFKFEMFICQLCGAWMHLKDTKLDFVYCLYWTTANISLIIYIIMKFMYLMEFSDVYGIVGSGFVLPMAIMGCVRCICFFKYRKAFCELMSSLDDEIFQPKDPKELIMYQQMFKFFSRFKYIIYAWSCVTSTGCQFFRVVFGVEDSPDDGQEHCEAAISTKQGAFVYIHHSMSVAMIFVLNLISDLFMVGFSLFIGFQCDRLCYQLENMKDTEIVEIKYFVQHYKRILRCAKQTEKLFGTIYFAFFFASLLAFCSTMFVLSITDRHSFRYFHMLEYIFAIFGMLFTPCWFATQVTRKSENIPSAVYSSPWIKAERKFQNDLIIFLNMVQTPIQFKALNLIPLSLDSYMSVMKTSFSYYTVLENVAIK